VNADGRPNFLKVDVADVSALVAELDAHGELWNRNPCRLSKRGPHHETDDIFLRYKDERPNLQAGDWSNFSDEHIPSWYAGIDMLPAARAIIFGLMGKFSGEMLGGVFIYRMRPGSRIYGHVDRGWHPEYFEKFNVCLRSNPAARFIYADDAMVQDAGEVHWFRNDVRHDVVNEGETDHIVMTVCIRMDSGGRVPPSPDGWTMDKFIEERDACLQQS
jgi:hypothetical protein